MLLEYALRFTPSNSDEFGQARRFGDIFVTTREATGIRGGSITAVTQFVSHVSRPVGPT
jgi:hypothetical protein